MKSDMIGNTTAIKQLGMIQIIPALLAGMSQIISGLLAGKVCELILYPAYANPYITKKMEST